MQPLFTDTHCHVHDLQFYAEDSRSDYYERSLEAGVHRMICVGTDVESSRAAVEFSENHEYTWAIVGIHPHEAKVGVSAVQSIKQLFSSKKVVGIGEIGLDYYYNHSTPAQQYDMLHAHLELATETKLPISFHVRDGFDDFWPIFDQYKGLRGVLHSYTDNLSNMEQALSRDLWIGVNGISTFAKERDEVNRAVPLQKILLETDAPFLTPKPNRGKINEPAFVRLVANYIADLRSISPRELSDATELSAQQLYF